MQKMLLNHGWEFSLTPPDEKPEDFAPVDIPHDWLIYDSKDLYKNGDGHYRRVLDIADASLHYTLRFEGVYMDCDIYLNGEKIFEWKYGYTTFDVPLIGLREGENHIEVLVRHRHPNSRWYSGAGIYRNVWLTVKGGSEIIPDGTYVTSRRLEDTFTDGRFATEIDTEVCGIGAATLRQTVYDACGNARTSAQTEVALSEDVQTVTQTLPAFKPLLWSPESPNLYTLRTELIQGEEVVDEVTEKIGYKTIEFTPDKGFFLNGEHCKLLGTCIHHDMGALGSAVNKNAIPSKIISPSP